MTARLDGLFQRFREFTLHASHELKTPLTALCGFDRFFRCDPSHNNDTEGCGLGLSIAQWIVTAHSGSIRLASEPGKLTRVTISLPLASRE